jgi:hypothetical protein
MIKDLPHVNWTYFPSKNGGKPRKVPVGAGGFPIDAHDEKNWITFEAASNNTGLNVAAVFSINDPYFFLDIDDCLTPANTWHDSAVELLGLFPFAAVEVSTSGKGLHVVGKCDKSLLAGRANRFKFKGVACEFYIDKRTMAYGHGFTGTVNGPDFTQVLLDVVPINDTEIHSLPQGRDKNWNGPEDDDELLKLAMKSKGSTSAIFGQKATFSQLWEAKPDVLAKFFPSSAEDQFNRSDADMALLSHLAFWTGRDAARMDRLFRRSGLMRDKFNKHGNYDYAGKSIRHAISSVNTVYSKPTPVITHSVSTITPVYSQCEVMTLEQQIEYFKGCVYITRDNTVLTPSGAILKQASFKNKYSGYQFMMSVDGSNPTKDAFEAFVSNRAVHFPKVYRTRFKPQEEFGTLIDGDGVNTYRDPKIRSVKGDVSPILTLLEKILPVERDRVIFLSWCAAVVQYPGVKFLWSPVLQGAEGIGKSVWGEILHYCVGAEYAWTVEARKVDSKFNSFLSKRLFINVEEMNIFEKHEMMETLKGLITGTKQEIEGKGLDSGMDLDYCANWFFTTNHKDAVIKTKNDRRFSVFFSAIQDRAQLVSSGLLDDEFYPKLWKWLKKEDGYAMVYDYLKHYCILDELNPATLCQIAPDTSSTGEAIGFSGGVAQQVIEDAIDQCLQGFRGGMVSSHAVSKLLLDNRLKNNPRNIAKVLDHMGYESIGRASNHVFNEGGGRPIIYKLKSSELKLEDYDTAQGYNK